MYVRSKDIYHHTLYNKCRCYNNSHNIDSLFKSGRACVILGEKLTNWEIKCLLILGLAKLNEKGSTPSIRSGDCNFSALGM